MRLSSPTRRRLLSAAACVCCVAPLTRFTASAVETDAGLPTILELGAEPMKRIGSTVWVAQIAPDVWLHTSTHPVGAFVYPANGLILLRDKKALLIDTGWTPEQARLLARWISLEQKAELRLAVATHFHNDRTGGVEVAWRKSMGSRRPSLSWVSKMAHGGSMTDANCFSPAPVIRGTMSSLTCVTRIFSTAAAF